MSAFAQAADNQRRSVFERVRSLDARALDIAAALLLTILALGDVLTRSDAEGFRSDDLLGIVLVLGQTVPLALRKASPLGVLVAVNLALVAHSALGYEVVQAGTFGSLVALYGASASTDSRGSAIAAGITVAAFAGFFGTNRQHWDLVNIVTTSASWAMAWFLGTFVKLERRVRARTRELQTLLEMSRTVTSTLDLQQLYEVALDHLQELIPYTGAAIQHVTEQGPRQVATRRPPDAPPNRRSAPAWYETSIWVQLQRGQPVVIDDIRGDEPLAIEYRAASGDLEEAGLAYFRSWMSVPLMVKERSIGAIGIVHGDTGFFTDDHVSLAQSVANQVAVAIENARLFEESARRARELGALLELSRSVASTLDLQQLFEVAIDRLRDLVPYTGANIGLRTEDGQMHSTVRRPGADQRSLQRRPGWPESDFMQTLRGRPVVVDDLRGSEPLAVEYRSWLTADIEETPIAYARSLMAVPLVVKGSMFGDITLTHEQPAYFTPDHVALIQSVANHLAVAISNASLFDESARRTRDLQALLEMSQAVTSTLDLQALFEVALDKLKDLIPYTGASIGLRTGNETRQITSRRPDGLPRQPLKRAPNWEAFPIIQELLSGKPLIIGDVTGDDPRAAQFRATFAEDLASSPMRYFRSIVTVPLMVKSAVIGDLSVTHEQPSFFKSEHVELAKSVANHLAIAIENARLFEETSRKTIELQALLETSEAVTSTLDLHELFDKALDQLRRLIPYSGANIGIRTERGVVQWAGRRPDGVSDEAVLRRPSWLESVFVRELEAGRPVVVDDIRGDEPMAIEYRDGLLQPIDESPLSHFRSLVAVPLIAAGRVIGDLTIVHDDPGFFGEEQVDLAQTVANHLAIGIQNARLFEETDRKAKELEALYQADEKLFASLDLDVVLQSLADIAVDVLGADKSMVSIGAGPENRMAPRAWRNISEDMRDFYKKREPGTGKPAFVRGEVVAAGLDDVSPDIRPVLEKEGIVSTLDVPIVFGGHIRGAFGLAWTRPHESTESEKASAFALAQRSAVAIQNADLYARAQQAASLEERQRLARELHDSVSQALYGIALGARTARTQLDREPAKAAEPMDYVLSLAEAGLAEMRALIFELRPESLETEGLVAALDKQLAAARARHGLSVTGNLGTEPEAGQDVKEAAYRIAQEALHNVVKHAQARSVTLDLADSPEALQLTITDDGRGFDPAADYPGHMGLRSMRERAAGAGGALTLDSSPGHGSTISVRFPKGRRNGGSPR